MRCLIAVVGLLALCPGDAASQRSIEVYGGGGYTAVNVDDWAGTEANDWNQGWQGGRIQVMLTEVGALSVGVEAGYQHLMWYEVPYTDYFIEYSVAATNLMAVVRNDLLGPLSAEVTAGVFLFEDWVDLALGAALGTSFPLSDALSLPLRVRTNLILDSDGTMIPLGIELGLAYRPGR